jgi:RNA polymerase sigma-70 factor (ECF subfamily)
MDDDRADDPAQWVDRHGDCLYRYALLRLRSPDLAADLVQETFLEAFRSRAAFEGRSSERTWLVGILKHKVLDHFRRQRRERPMGEAAEDGERDEPAFDRRGHWRRGPSSWGADPSESLERREFWDVLGQCVAKLPPRLADAFLLRELDGLEAAEVQSLLGITPANLWARLHRARSLLRQCLESRWSGRRSSAAAHSAKGASPR